MSTRLRLLMPFLLSVALPLRAGPAPAIGACGHAAFPVLQERLLAVLEDGEEPEKILSGFVLPHPENCLRVDHPLLRQAWLLALSDSPTHSFVLCKGLAFFARRSDPPPEPKIFLRLLAHPDAEVRSMTGLVIGLHPAAFADLPENGILSSFSNESHPAVREVLRWTTESLRNGPPRRSNPFTRKESGSRLIPFFQAGIQNAAERPFNNAVFQPERDFPEALSFTHPVLDYEKELVFATPRISFGAGGGNIHIGDDCAWFRDMTPVFSISDGLVRLVLSTGEWGNLILIEHREGTNRFCSLYGHVADPVMVRAGETVQSGRLIGMTGISYSSENGGYGSHLHFAVAEGPWLKSLYRPGRHIRMNGPDGPVSARIESVTNGTVILKSSSGTASFPAPAESLNDRLQWIKGYQIREDGAAGWLDPLEFLRQRIPAAP